MTSMNQKQVRKFLSDNGAVARRVSLGMHTFTTPKGEVRTIERTKEVHDLRDGSTVEVIQINGCDYIGRSTWNYRVETVH